MLEKWKQRAMKMNLRKAVAIFIITGFVLAIACSVAVYSNFQDRFSEWEQSAERGRNYGGEERESDGDHGRKDRESDREYQSGSRSRENDGNFKDKERKEGDWENILKTVRLSVWDVALIVGCGITGMVLGIWCWVLILIAVYRKARRMGVNMALWMAAAVVFNLAALVVLYLYGMLKGTCEKCGKVICKGGKFCGRCGSPLEKTCRQCGQAAELSSIYCGSCGRKLDEEEKQ